MALVTGTVQDLGYDGMDGTLWARPARFRSDGSVVLAPERKPYKITGGVVSAELAPGPAVLELQVGSHARGTFEVVIPEEDTTLADLLDTVFPWEPAQVSLFVAEREKAQQAAEAAETSAGTASTAATQTGLDRAHVDSVRDLLDDAYDQSQAGMTLPPRLMESELNATYRTTEYGGFDALDPDYLAADHSPAPCITPTYDGSGQAVHPGVWYFPHGWCGYKFWMGMTPYPYGNDAVEQPSLLASHDGQTWEVPPGVSNPIDQPANGFWPDTDLIFWNNRLYLWWAVGQYRWTDDGGKTWSPRVSGIGITGSVSPTVVADGPNIYVWTVAKEVAAPNRLLRHTATDMAGPFGDVTDCAFTLPPGRDLWHIQMRKVGAQYAATFTTCDAGTSGANAELHFATSADGVAWDVGAVPILRGEPGQWADKMIYRSAIVPLDGRDGDLFWLWYTGLGSNNEWHIGRTTIRSTKHQQALARTDRPITATSGIATVAGAANQIDSFVLSDNNVVPKGWSNNLLSATNRRWIAGEEAFAYTTPAASGNNLSRLLTVAPDEDRTFSLEVKTDQPSARARLSLQWRNASNGVIRTDNGYATGLAEYRRAVVSGKSPSNAASVLILVTLEYSGPDLMNVYLRRPQWERGAVPSPYRPAVASVFQAADGQTGDIHQVRVPSGTDMGSRVRSGVSPQGYPYFVPRTSLPSATRVGEVVLASGVLWLAVAEGSSASAWERMPTTVVAAGSELSSATSAVNTTGKFAGKQVWVSGVSRPVWSTGSAATSPWVDGQGVAVYTPA